MALKEDTVHIPDLTFVPVGAVEQTNDRGNGGDLVGVGLDTDARLMGVGEEVVDDLERGQHTRFAACAKTRLKPVGLGGEVDGGDVDDLPVLALGVVAEKGEDGEDGLGGDVDGELVLVDGELLDVFGEGGEEVLAVLVEGRLGGGEFLCGVHACGLLEGRDRRLLLAAGGEGEGACGGACWAGRAGCAEGEEGRAAGHRGAWREESGPATNHSGRNGGRRRVPPPAFRGYARRRVCGICMAGLLMLVQPRCTMPDEENGTPPAQETAGEAGEAGETGSDVDQQPQHTEQPPPHAQEPHAQENPPTPRDSNPPAPPKKKLFTSLNVNQKFLSKTTTPAPTPGPQKQQNGKPVINHSCSSPSAGRQASPVPIPSTSRQLSTKLHTMPISKPSASPNPPPSSTHSSPWAKPAVPTPSPAPSTLHQPAPTRPGISASIPTSAAASLSGPSLGTGTAGRNVWRMGGLGSRSGMTTEFPTAKEAADGMSRIFFSSRARARDTAKTT